MNMKGQHSDEPREEVGGPLEPVSEDEIQQALKAKWPKRVVDPNRLAAEEWKVAGQFQASDEEAGWRRYYPELLEL